MAANISTSIAAVMTVLIGMFLLGLFIALGSWVISWTNHVKKDLVVNVYFCTELTCGKEASRRRSTRSTPSSTRTPRSSPTSSSPRRTPGRRCRSGSPELDRGDRPEPAAASFEVIPNDADQVQSIAAPSRAAASRRRDGEVRREEGRAGAPGGDDHRRDLPGGEHHPPDRVDDPDREHDPPLHLLAEARDRGDEARRRVELVRARALHARGPALRPRRLRSSRSSSCSSRRSWRCRGSWAGSRARTTSRRGASRSWRSSSSAMSLLVGAAGSGITLRRFLRI